MKLVVDCANGAAYHIAPPVFEELGAEVIAIANQPNGFNINEACGSTSPDFLSTAVREHGADAGIALDGDGDRVMMATRNGEILDGDQLLFAMMQTRMRRGGLNGGLVGTLMTNMALELACRDQGVGFHRANVGDRYVLQGLAERGWVLGGETSGHIICLDKTTTGDGIVAALEVLSCMTDSGDSLSEVVAGLDKFPQIMENVRLANNGPRADQVLADDGVCEAVKHAERSLHDRGRVVMRASGTEPLIRVMVEGQDADAVSAHVTGIAEAVREAAGA